MQAVLYVCHGSRIDKGIAEAIAFIKKVKKEVNVPLQQISFLELASPSILEGISLLVKKGATSIAVIPVLLLSGAHIKQDIPKIIMNAQKRYPHISFLTGQPLGVHEKMVDVLFERMIEESPVKKGDCVLLVGRGSNDSSALRDLGKIGRRLQQKFKISYVQTCFLAAAHPTIKEGLELIYKIHFEKVYVIPYVLFSGIVMKEIKQQLKSFSREKENIIFCNALGYHPYIQDVLKERVFNTLNIDNTTNEGFSTEVG